MLERLLDYGRHTFELFRDQPILLMPALVRLVLVISLGGSTLATISITRPLGTRVLGSLLALVGLLLTAVMVALESGQLYWFSLAVSETTRVDLELFFEGIRRFFWRIVGASLLGSLIAALVGFPLMFLLLRSVRGGLSAAFWLVPLVIIPVMAVVGVFLAFWHVAIVRNDCGIFDGLRDSFELGGRFFWSVLAVILARGLLGGGWGNQPIVNINADRLTDFTPHWWFFTGAGIIGSIAATAVSVFFSLYLFLMYEDLKAQA